MIKRCSQTVNIAAVINIVCRTALLRRGVIGCADRALFQCKSHIAGNMTVAFAFGNAQVHKFIHAVIGQHDVGRLYIAVNHPGFEQRVEGVCHRNQHFGKLIFAERFFFGKFVQGFAIHILHGYKQIPRLEITAHIKHFDDIGVIELMRQFGFPQKAFYRHIAVGTHIGSHQFYGTKLFKQKMFCQIDFRHTAFAQQADDLVFIEYIAILKHTLVKLTPVGTVSDIAPAHGGSGGFVGKSADGIKHGSAAGAG